MLVWEKLLHDNRRKPKKSNEPKKKVIKEKEARTEIERDYDRILFSTPVRRLQDKTQVFPLERNDSVRTRLTHSHEVSNLSRSIGVDIAFNEAGLIDESLNPKRNLPAMLAAIGLVHDLGNPPFGHQGERAIQAWVKENKRKLFDDPPGKELSDAMRDDFLKFEGNAQTLRLVTKLQLLNDEYGLNLTYGTLAALMKYPIPSDKVEEKTEDYEPPVSKKKHGYFQSEQKIVADIWEKTGLSQGIRHPLTYIMEACDDIAYSVLDAEDAVKKSLVSFSDLIGYLKHHGQGDECIEQVIGASCEKFDEFRQAVLSPQELNDVSMQMFRVNAITAMIPSVKESFVANNDKIMKGEMTADLIGQSRCRQLCKVLKAFDKEHAYVHKSVLEIELIGYNTITKLMDYFWQAITERSKPEKLGSKRKSPFASYAYGRISENYRRVFEDGNNDMPVRYKELQLLTDMISGMSDSFAIALLAELEKYDVR